MKQNMRKSYENYTLEDFISDDDFIQWAKYPTEESDSFWQAFIEKESDKAAVVRQAQLAVQQLALVSKQNTPKSEIPLIWDDLTSDLDTPQKRIFSIVQGSLSYWVAAACMILVMAGGYRWWYIKYHSTPQSMYAQLVSNTKNPLREIVNTTSSNLEIVLPDGSKSILEPKSRLSFSQAFKGVVREVYLSGEAFFDVKKNPEKPFLVYANGLIVKVLGTSFRVKAYEEDKQVMVQVKTGRVSVFAHKTTQNPDPETEGLVLTSNQKVVFGKLDERLNRTLVEKPMLLLSSQELQKFSFNNAPVTKIFTALEKAYGVDIVFDEEVLANCSLTTSLTNENLFEKLDIICEGIEASYKVVDAQVIISSKGCN